MSGTVVKRAALPAVLAAALLLPAAANAQEIRTKSAPPASPAFALESRALAWLETPARWPDVARALEQAAALRGAEDRRAIDDLLFAAGAHWSAGELAGARAAFVSAGEAAISHGEVFRAAYAFLLGAVAANEANDPVATLELRTRAERLARSPVVTPAQRQRIFAQFTGAVGR